jgi:hypothetical protein
VIVCDAESRLHGLGCTESNLVEAMGKKCSHTIVELRVVTLRLLGLVS